MFGSPVRWLSGQAVVALCVVVAGSFSCYSLTEKVVSHSLNITFTITTTIPYLYQFVTLRINNNTITRHHGLQQSC